MRCITNAEGVYVNRCVYTTYVCMYMYVCLYEPTSYCWLAG